MKIKCPICNGTGKLSEPLNIPKNLIMERAQVIKTLRDNGYSIREIMKIMKFKSTRSVTWHLEKLLTA